MPYGQRSANDGSIQVHEHVGTGEAKSGGSEQFHLVTAKLLQASVEHLNVSSCPCLFIAHNL